MHSNIFGKYLGLNSTSLKVKGNEALKVAFKMLLSPNLGLVETMPVASCIP